MKKLLSLVMVLALCLSMGVTALAADNYVPSIGDKQEPDIVVDGDVVATIEKYPDGTLLDDITMQDACLVVTSVATAQAGTNNIPPDAKEILLDVYQKLKDGSMKLPYEDLGKDSANMEIRDLFDVSLLCEEHEKMLEEGTNVLKVTFNLGVKSSETVYAMVYVDGQWKKVPSCVNNGDGTVTVKFSEICPVVFCIEAKTPPAQTGDANRNTVAIYGGVLAVSAAAMVGLVVVYRKKAAEE